MTKSTNDEIARKIGPYRIEERLGTGGMGQVYRAYDERLDRRVALKQIQPHKAEDHRVRQRFLREARSAARLSHPAIVQVHDILEADGSDWIVMELVEGETLRATLEKSPLTLARAINLTLELASGLAAAHAEGVIHRDLKAENVILENTSGRARILDFGLAKRLLSEADEEAALTVDGQLLGTPRAMSPEQAMGQELDLRSDLFSLGSLAYEIVTGFPPFEGSDPSSTLQKICRHRQLPLRQVRDDVPSGFSNLVERLLEKDRSRRPQTADEVVEALRHLLQELDLGLPLPDNLPLPDPSTPIAETETIDDLSSKIRFARRRQITVMCCDLVSITESSSSLDPELLYLVLPDFQQVTEEILGRFQGHLETVLSHRLLAYFGVPDARDDDPRRAVEAALAIVAEIEALDRRTPRGSESFQFAARIAIHTGPAVVLAAPDEKLALGRTLDLTTGLVSLTPPGTVVTSSATYDLVAELFEAERQAEVRIQGFDQPVASYRVARR